MFPRFASCLQRIAIMSKQTVKVPINAEQIQVMLRHVRDWWEAPEAERPLITETILCELIAEDCVGAFADYDEMKRKKVSGLPII